MEKWVKKSLSVITVVFHVVAVAASLEPHTDLVFSTFLDAANNYHVAWNFDDSSITFELQVRTTGYIGFGFSPNGKMEGSDIVIGWVNDTTGQPSLTDRHAVGRWEPIVDKRDDYDLISASQNATHTVLRFIRPLDLCGDEDRKITTDTIRLIWAYNSQDPDPTGLRDNYHGTNRGTKSLHLLNFQKAEPPMPSETSEIDFLMSNLEIPSNRHTTYWCKPFKVPKYDSKVHAVKVEPIITPGLESEVHHIIVYGCYHPTNDSYTTEHECYSNNMPEDWWGCTSTIFAWAIGGGAFFYPEHAGFPLGGEGDPTLFLMEMHYDNPQLKKNRIDSSGLRVTVTPQLRMYDAEMLDTGVSVAPTQVIPPNTPHFRSEGHCFPECLAQAMSNQTTGIKAFAVLLHAHLLGRAIRLRHFRDGIEQEQIIADENYDFNFQELVALKEEITILPGDHLMVECDYSSTDKDSITYGGLSTQDEMCLAFILYYPKIALSTCHSGTTVPHLANFAGATVGNNGLVTDPPEHRGKYITQLLEETVDWKDESTAQRFQDYINREDVNGTRVSCKKGLLKYPIHSQTRKLPMKFWTLETVDTCGVTRALGTDSILLGVLSLMCTILMGR